MSLTAPRICEGFHYKSRNGMEGEYRCDGYMRLAVPGEKSLGLKRRRTRAERKEVKMVERIMRPKRLPRRQRLRLHWTDRAHAEFATGSGVCGCMAPIQDVIRSGKLVPWKQDMIDEHRRSSARRTGELFWQGSHDAEYVLMRPPLARRFLNWMFAWPRKD